VGIYEYQVGRLTPEFVRDFNDYTSTLTFGIEFLSTGLPQMRTIPVHRSIQPQHHVSTFDEVSALLNGAPGPFVILECICRKKKSIEGEACRVTRRGETCLAIGDLARPLLESGSGREVTRTEALSILELNQKEGLVLQPSNTQQADFICSCCGCCCGMLRLQQRLPKPLDFWVSNFRAQVESGACTGCGVCEKRCQVGAVHVDEGSRQAMVDPDRCIGCGVCVPACPTGAMALSKKAAEISPPRSRQDLYDAIMARKKGRLAKVGLTTKILADAVRTGQLSRLRASSK
jgi:ferredoxin